MINIRILDGDDAHRLIDALAAILHDAIMKGASVGFMKPFSMTEAVTFYTEIAARVQRDEIILFAAFNHECVVGTCQLIPSKKPNQIYRADLVKLLVHSNHRDIGIGASLLVAVDNEVKRQGFKLVTLDTGLNTAEAVYERAGYQRAGIIPKYALFPDGTYCDTVFFYKWYD